MQARWELSSVHYPIPGLRSIRGFVRTEAGNALDSNQGCAGRSSLLWEMGALIREMNASCESVWHLRKTSRCSFRRRPIMRPGKGLLHRPEPPKTPTYRWSSSTNNDPQAKLLSHFAEKKVSPRVSEARRRVWRGSFGVVRRSSGSLSEVMAVL